MAGDIEFTEICYETRGIFVRGRLKFTDTMIQYKNNKTGKVEQIPVNDVDHFNWVRFCLNWGIRAYTKGGTLYRFGGFKDADKEKITGYVKSTYDLPMPDKDICVKGWNWGTAKFSWSTLSFEVDNKLDFEIPLRHVSQCIAGKNEVTLEFHPNEEAAASLMELRFHIPSSEMAGDDPVDSFRDHVLQKADVISAVGDAVAIFREVHCLTPRGRYDIKVYPSFFQLHGKTFDYKIAMSTVLRLFLLPHKDGRQIFFVVSLDPPIKQGQTRYHYLTFLFQQDEDDVTIELPFTDEELKTKYDGKLTREMSGHTYEVVSRLMRVLINRKLTSPGSFVGHSGTPAIGCSYKAAAGYIYPLERGFIFIHKPPLHIRFEEVSCVNFARSGGSTRSFDFEVELRSNVIYTFSSIEKEEYPKLFDFVNNKKIRIKNSGKNNKQPTASFADFDASDNEAEPDAYLARVKAEAAEADDDDDDDDEGSDVDADFDPGQLKGASDDDVAEEFDSNASESSSDEDDEEGGSSSKHKKKKVRRDKEKSKSSSQKSSKSSSSSKKKSSENGEKPKKKSSKSKPSSSSDSKPSTSTSTSKKSSTARTSSGSTGAGGEYKSKEFISDSDSSD